MAVQVLKSLAPEYSSARLTLAGQDKGMLQTLKTQVEAEGLEGCIRFVGFLDMPGKQKEFAAHDIFLNTNHVDNMPVSVLEASAFGLPVVATAVGGIPSMLIQDETALLVQDGDVVGMAEAVKRLLTEDGLAARLSINGRRLAETCSWPEVKKQWVTLFAGVLRSGGIP
jgi:glycosyltransferase involved in cell wall biosynthesis